MLRSVALFSDLSEAQFAYLSGHSTLRSYAKGTIILSEGDEGNSLYVIESGSVKVFLRDPQGKEVVLSNQGPGEYFGDLAIFDDAPRSASVVAVESCRLRVLSKAAVRQAMLVHPELAQIFLRGLAARIRILTESVRTLALLDVFGRLVRALYSLAREENGSMVIDHRLTQQEIASRIGSSREMVSRIMHDLVQGGYVSLQDGRIVILRKIPSQW